MTRKPYKQREISPILRMNVLKAIADIFDVPKVWVSVKQYSIGKMLKKHQVPNTYSDVIVKILEENNLITWRETETGIEYRITTTDTPDLSVLTEEAIQQVREFKKLSNKLVDIEPRNPDLNPKITPKQKDTNGNGEVLKDKVIARRPLQIGDIKYLMKGDKINEVRICVISEFDETTLVCTVTHNNPNEEPPIWTEEMVPAGQLFPSPALLVTCLLKHISKNSKRYAKEITNYED